MCLILQLAISGSAPRFRFPSLSLRSASGPKPFGLGPLRCAPCHKLKLISELTVVFYLNLSVSFSRFSRSQAVRLSPSAPRSRSLAGPFPERLDIIPRTPPPCQQLFSIFFSFFQTCFKSRTFAWIPSVFCVLSDRISTTGRRNVRFWKERMFSLRLNLISHFAFLRLFWRQIFRFRRTIFSGKDASWT